MMNYSFILAVLAAVSTAVPTPQASSSAAVSSITPQQVPTPSASVHCGNAITTTHPTPAKVSITTKQVLIAAPGSASCAPGGTVCSTPDVAAAALNTAFEKFGHTSLGQQAALLGLMTFESGDFKFNTNEFPGRPGQGTKAMLMFKFVMPYALAQPELKSQVLQLSGGSTDPDSIPDATKNKIRELVLTNQFTFGAASWFLNNECAASVSTQLVSGELAAFQDYITNCVGTTFDGDRKANWCLAFNALKSPDVASPEGC